MVLAFLKLLAIEGLWSIAPNDPVIMPELTHVLLPNSELQGDEAFGRLLKMGPAAKPALPQIRALLQTHDWRIRRATRDLLEKLESSDTPKPAG